MPDETTREYWIIDWLKRHGPAEWHGYVERHDWNGESHAPLEWIVAQAECDAATAATIFWLAEPDYYLDGRNDDHPLAKLLLAVAARWENEGFEHRRFSWDEGFPELVETINAGPHKVPPSLAEPIEGDEDFTWFTELPREIDIAWHRANGREPPEYLLAPADPPRSVAARPGSFSRDEAAALWAQLGPTSAFAPRPLPPTPPEGVIGRLRRWLSPRA